MQMGLGLLSPSLHYGESTLLSPPCKYTMDEQNLVSQSLLNCMDYSVHIIGLGK